MFSDNFTHYAQTAFTNRLPLLGKTGEAVSEQLSACPEGIRELLQFYYGFMPLSDAFTYDFDLFYRYAAHAASLRRTEARCAALPEEIFLHDVAWYRINSEKIVDCRSFFQEQVSPLIQGLDETQAVLAVNYWCASQASYEASDERTQSPLSVYRSGSGRCGEESTFLVSVLRSVGIPARQVYVPRWAHCDDNHAWVEVYVEGTWHFLGACEPEEVLDRGWFTNASTRAVLVYARTFTDYGVENQIAGRDGCVRFLNVTEHYAETKNLRIRVTDGEDRPISGASVSVEILNMAEFCSVLTLTTGADGTAGLTMGLGDVLVRAWKDGLCAETPVGAEDREIRLKLTEAPENMPSGRTELEIRAPKDGVTPWPVPEAAQKAVGRARLKEADTARERKLSAFREEAARAAESYPDEADIFLRARGNVAGLKKFLDGEDWKQERKELLHSLSDKDFRDLDPEILQEQLRQLAPLSPDVQQRMASGAQTDSASSREVFVRCCLCPRIGMEELTAFAPAVKEFFPGQERAAFRKRPECIWEWEQAHLKYLPSEDYDTLKITPPAALRGLWADETGKRTLFVAICRTLGIPARLNPVTGQAEYLTGNEWREVSGEAGAAGDGPEEAVTDRSHSDSASARLLLLTSPEDPWSYAQTWSIGRLSGMGYETLNYEGIHPENGRMELRLKSGIYRLITTNRMPGGSQYASIICFHLKEGEERTLEMKLHRPELKDLLVKNPLPAFTLQDGGGNTVDSASLLNGAKSLLIFVEEGKEPTEHVLNELPAEKERMERLSCRLILVADSTASLENPLLNRTADVFETAEVYFDEGLENAEPVARRMYVAPDLLPLLVAVDEQGCGIYACSGYHVGSVGLALKLLEMGE
ncbi:MAG TPA: transglutaminase-like domain-containing protein [Candidatus Eisenbergiella stercoravium]|nr:transglutaminase-like domain-containing protein [Candidatus Eisenbergiella stercoravium]